ncbi:hypothetical protein Tco_0531950 [Tanacetum coccineum]
MSLATRLHNFHQDPEFPTLLPTEEPVLGADYYDVYTEKLQASTILAGEEAGKVVKKRTVKSSKQLVDEFIDEGVPTAKPSLKTQRRRYSAKVLEEGAGKGERESSEERIAQVPLHLQTTKKKKHRLNRNAFSGQKGAQDEGQAGPDPGKLDEGQAGPNPDDVAEPQLLPTPSVLAGPNLEHSKIGYVEITNPSTLPSVLPPMTSPVIGPVPRPDSPNVHWPLPTTTTTTHNCNNNNNNSSSTTSTTTRLPSDSIMHSVGAPLRARSKDLPTSDMKKILLQRSRRRNMTRGRIKPLHINHHILVGEEVGRDHIPTVNLSQRLSKAVHQRTIRGADDYDGSMRSTRSVMNEERRCQKQGVHVRYPETAKDTTYLPESGKLCWWKDSRRRLPVAEENRMRGRVIEKKGKVRTENRAISGINTTRYELMKFLEHPSDTKVLTMKMEILLEPPSNKLLVGDMQVWEDFDGYPSDDLILITGNPVKDILLKMNLPDHRSVLTRQWGQEFSGGSSYGGNGDTSVLVELIHSPMPRLICFIKKTP